MPGDDRNLKFGLNHTTIEQISRVFSTHPQIEQVIIYGSRAKGNYREADV